MNKHNPTGHLDHALKVANWCLEADLDVGAFFIIGYPGGKVAKKWKQLVQDEYADSIIANTKEDMWIKGEDRISFEKTLTYAERLQKNGVKFFSPLIATPYPATNLYKICQKFKWLRYSNSSEIVTTFSYQNPREEFINISTPWCSHEDIFARWLEMCETFKVKHNIIKEK